jgi:hypothetical protein
VAADAHSKSLDHPYQFLAAIQHLRCLEQLAFLVATAAAVKTAAPYLNWQHRTVFAQKRSLPRLKPGTLAAAFLQPSTWSLDCWT